MDRLLVTGGAGFIGSNLFVIGGKNTEDSICIRMS